jgi:hypothetical protein
MRVNPPNPVGCSVPPSFMARSVGVWVSFMGVVHPSIQVGGTYMRVRVSGLGFKS